MWRINRQSAPYEPCARTPAAVGPAFTLIEMVVVVAIIVIIIAISLPAISTMWDKQKIADADNKIQGLLMTTRSRAVAGDQGEQGLLVYLDDKGAQRMVPIAQAKVPDDPPCAAPTLNELQACRDAYRLAYLDVFAVQDAQQVVLPTPLRVVPRYVVIPDATRTADQVLTFSDAELANPTWNALAPGNNQAQRHRNYFAMVFSTDGQLLDRRNVLIQDIDDDGDGRGDLAGLPSSYDHQSDMAQVTQYYDKSDDQAKPLDPTGNASIVAIPYLVVEATDTTDPPNTATTPQKTTAINFPAVDGLLLYDDAQFREIEDPADKRKFLLGNARPIYVNRITGAIIRGPVGEGEPVQ